MALSVCKEFGADVVYSEMASATALFYNLKLQKRYLTPFFIRDGKGRVKNFVANSRSHSGIIRRPRFFAPLFSKKSGNRGGLSG
jgi:hypothetical protein